LADKVTAQSSAEKHSNNRKHGLHATKEVVKNRSSSWRDPLTESQMLRQASALTGVQGARSFGAMGSIPLSAKARALDL